MAVTSNLLTSAALALAALSMFFSLWWTEVEDGLDVTIEVHRVDRGPEISKVTSKLRRRALPLAFSSCVLVVMLAPPAIAVLVDFFRSIVTHGVYALRNYNSVDAMFIAVWSATLALALMMLGKVRDLRRLLSKLRAIA
jgi:hypothetical protein